MGFSQSNDFSDPFPGFSQAISIVPQYVSISGFRMDYDRKLGDGRHWLILAPQYYSDKNGIGFYDEMSGFGMNVQVKKFISHSASVDNNGISRTNVYFMAGPSLQYFNTLSVEEVPEEYMENGTSYIRFNPEEVHTPIYKIGFNTDFGLQFVYNQFFFDFYAGIGLRFALDEDGETMGYYNENWFDMGYTGIMLDGGIRLGFIMK